MAYFLGYEYFDWNMFKRILNLYDLKTRMRNIDYSKLKKKRINVLLGQLCRSDKFNQFLNMNDFCDSGLEFVYEWVKTQLKIYFYLYQNKKIPRIKISKSTVDVYKNKYNILNDKNSNSNELYDNKNNKNNFDEKISNNTGISNNHLNSSNCYQKNTQRQIIESLMFKNSTDIETINYDKSNTLNHKVNFINSNINSINNNLNNTFQKRNNSLNYGGNISKSTHGNNSLLITSLPNIIPAKESKYLDRTNESTFIPYQKININKIYNPIEAKKVNIKIKGFNKEREKLIKEIRTAEMLPLLKNKTFHQMRNFFDDKVPFSRKIDKKIKKEINSYSLNGTNDEQRLISLIAGGKIKALNYESLFKLKKILGN
jgi:hypothetical protein